MLKENDAVITHGFAGELTAIVSLAHDIPNELLTLSATEYSDYEAGIGAIEYTLQVWLHRADISGLMRTRGKSPLVLVHHALTKCPDQAPSSGTVELPFVSDAVLRESIRRDISAANQDLLSGEWKGATVLAGSAVETLLLWTLQNKRSQTEVNAAVKVAVAAKRLSRPGSSNPETWGLSEYIEVALEMKVISENTAKQVRLAKDYRNLIHPGRAQRLAQVCDRATALSAVAAVEHVVRDLT